MTRDEVRIWLDRRPPQRFDGVGLVGEALLKHRAWHIWLDAAPCAECEGRDFVVAECATFGWRMVPCEKCNQETP